MPSLELASWVLAALTALLTIATFYYAVITHKMFKSSRETQKLLEAQNCIISTHNDLLKEQTEALHSQAKALFDLANGFRYIADAISNLPFDTQEIKNKIEKSRSLKK